MTSFLRSLAAAVLLAAAGSAANATTYDLSYVATFEYLAPGTFSGPAVTGTLTGQLEGTATTYLGQAGVDFSSFSSLTFTDTNGKSVNLLDDGPMTDFGAGSDFLAFSSPLTSRFYTENSTSMNGIELMIYGTMTVFHTPAGDTTHNWLADTNTGTWSLTEHVTSTVPEPATALLALLGAPLVGWRARRRSVARIG